MADRWTSSSDRFAIYCEIFHEIPPTSGPQNILPLRFRKAGRVWLGGARETHSATCHNGVTPSRTKEFLKSPCFLDLNGNEIHTNRIIKKIAVLSPSTEFLNNNFNSNT